MSDDPPIKGNKRYPRRATRRRILQTVGIGAATGVAGCLGDGDGDGDGDGNGDGGDGDGDGDGDGGSDGGDGSTPEETATPVPDADQVEVGGEWVSADSTDAESMYFPEVTDANTSSRIGLTMDGAYAVGEGNEVMPLWMDITDSGDSQVFVCELRDNLQWSEPYGQMTAEDWVFQIQEVHMNAGIWDADSPPSTQDEWSQIENVEQTGELEFQIELPETSPDFPLEPVVWGSYCMPKGLYEEYAPDADSLRESEEVQQLQYTGNLGPYSFDRWERQAEFVTSRNDGYYMQEWAGDDDDQFGLPEIWGDAPYLESSTYRVIEEESSRLQALEQEEITTAGIPAGRYQDFQDNDDIDVYEIPQPFLTILAYNQRMNGWDQLQTREVRQALSMAIDKTAITEQILRGLAEYTHTFQPQWSKWYDDSQVSEFGAGDSYDQNQARQLLEEHTSSDYGYDGDEFRGPDGQVELTLVFTEGTETTQTTAEYMGQELGSIGIDVSFETVTFDQLLGQYLQNEWQGDDDPPWTAGPYNAGPRDNTQSAEQWDMMYGINFNTYPRTPAATDAFWTEQSGTNYYGYVPEEDMESKFEDFRTTTDEGERQEIIADIFGILSRDQPVNFVAMSDDIIGYQNYVVGPREAFGANWDSNIWYFDDE